MSIPGPEEYAPDAILVVAPLVLNILVEGPGPHAREAMGETKAAFIYDPDDPLAVQIDIRSPRGVVSWVFARELLAKGLRRGTGDGDVYIGRQRGHMRMVLENATHSMLVFTALGPVKDFLARTYAVVSIENEARELDTAFDNELGCILREEDAE